MRPDTLNDTEIFTFTSPRKGGSARGHLEGDCLVVLKGSWAANRAAPSMPRRYAVLRQELIDVGILARDSQGDYFFSRDYKFSNPSEAACVVQGGSRNGYDHWKDASGKALKAYGWYRSDDND